MPTDSSAIDDALIAKLLGDATLMALTPDGVYMDEANPRAQRFVIVSLVNERASMVFEGRAIEDTLYSVKAVILVASGGNARAAAARIDELLDEGTLSVSGYGFMAVFRDDDDGRIRYTEIDAADKETRWQHRGGRYRVQVSPLG